MKVLKILSICFDILTRGINKYIKNPINKTRFKKVGRKVNIGMNSFFSYENISIGDNVSIGINSTFLSSDAFIRIGNNVMFGPGVTIVTGDHRIDKIGEYMINTKDKLPENDKDVVIEDDVWIGCNVTILKGVTIGRGSVVAAGSLIVKDVESYSIYGGLPAKKLKDRFTKDQVAKHENLLYGEDK